MFAGNNGVFELLMAAQAWVRVPVRTRAEGLKGLPALIPTGLMGDLR